MGRSVKTSFTAYPVVLAFFFEDSYCELIVFPKPETAELRQQPKRGIMRTWIREQSVGLQRRGGRDPIGEFVKF